MASQADIRRIDNSIDQTSNTPQNRFTPHDNFVKRGDGKSKYNIDSQMYPYDLMDPNGIYGGNYVVFYINVPVDSKLVNGENAAQTVADYTPGERGFTVGANYTKEQVLGAQTILAAGGAVAGKVLGVGGAGAGAGALAVAGTAVTLNVAATTTRAQKRLATAIALHVPNQLATRYGVTYGEEDTMGLSAAATLGKDIWDAISKAGDMKDAAENLKNVAKGPGQAVITNLALSKGPNAGVISAATGLAPNPKRDQVFKGVDFRNFTFEYQFFPRDSGESKKVLEIIRLFKYHMHPEYKDTNKFLYIYPSEFDIVYYQGGQENPNINKHTSCVLTEMSVNYTPNGNFSTFADGMPTQINVSMQFRELALLSKELIDKGM